LGPPDPPARLLSPGRVRSRIEALSECAGYFKPLDLVEQLENELEWFQLLDIFVACALPANPAEENPEGQAVILMYWRASPDPWGKHDWYFWCPSCVDLFFGAMHLPRTRKAKSSSHGL
jgi:hypothetical protein